MLELMIHAVDQPTLDSDLYILDRPLYLHLLSGDMGMVEKACETYPGPDLIQVILVDDGVRTGL